VRLTRLQLNGFKSFADSTELLFEPGVTAIVGPNGCGKSNVSDAVRWVLGEQRARALRGTRMEEVIFQGSTARRPVNIAEVSLHFDNSEGVLAVPFREVVITRRLSRSGESEYLLNGTPCRLRDIHDMVRGTGLGADAGVVIEARMLDALLSDRPDERRELFEEAAGVGLYRDRRRTTERRLEETTADLARLDDLISEVQSQVRSLARQRKRAERHTELTARRFTAELTLASREMRAWREELDQLEERVQALRAALPRLESAVAQAEATREAAHAARTVAEARRAELGRVVSTRQQDVMRLESELRVAEERHSNAVLRRQRAEEERRSGEMLGSRLTEDHASARGERSRVETELTAALEELARCSNMEESARAALAAARRAHEDIERLIGDAQDGMRRATLDRESAEREQEELARRADALEHETAQLADAVELAHAEAEHATRLVDEHTHAVEQAAQAALAARQAADEARTADAAARGDLRVADEQVVSLEGKMHALEALERERVGLAPAAARLLRERDRFGDGAILGPLSDFVTAGTSGAATVERFLGATVHAVLVRDGEVAAAVRAWHAETDPGPLLLLPLDATTQGDQQPGSLSDLVEAAQPAEQWVRALLGRVRALEAATGFVDAHGAIWLPGTGVGPGPLRRRAELRGLADALAAASVARDSAGTAAASARKQLAAAEQAAGRAVEEHAAAQRALRQARDGQDAARRQHERAGREHGSVTSLARQLATRRAELVRTIAELAERHQQHDAEHAERVQRRAASASQLAELEQQHESSREARTRCQVEEAHLRARAQVSADRESRLQAEVSAANTRLGALLAELSDLEAADSALAARMTEWRAEREARQLALQDAQTELERAEFDVASADRRLEDADHALDAGRREAAQGADSLHHAELRFTELAGRRTAIRERLEAEWRRPLDEMLATLTPAESDDDTLRGEVAALRSELEAIGPVNPLAIEEHAEELKRAEFLNAQRTDLQNARNALQQAIREIDVTARAMFLEMFARVRGHFREIFMTLFGGGECDLRLESPETPLDCDIEIHASPRGKRTQRIHLLSSGERALVALSLLFGIFLAKPSPFCLLDEVDAPLDDQNVGRFVRMLNEFKHKTQFIVITHNPRTTTEAADAVYGVTMQEPGVSSFVSVRLQGALQAEEGPVPVAVWDDAANAPDAHRDPSADDWDEDARSGAPLSHPTA